MLAADGLPSRSDLSSSQQSSQQSSQPISSLTQHSDSNKQSLRHIGFQPLSHMGANQSASSHPAHTWQDASVMTPRQLAVEQLLSHKLYGLPSQQASVSPQSADILPVGRTGVSSPPHTPGPVSPEPSKPGTSAAHDAAVNDNHSVYSSSGLQVLLPSLLTA